MDPLVQLAKMANLDHEDPLAGMEALAQLGCLVPKALADPLVILASQVCQDLQVHLVPLVHLATASATTLLPLPLCWDKAWDLSRVLIHLLATNLPRSSHLIHQPMSERNSSSRLMRI